MIERCAAHNFLTNEERTLMAFEIGLALALRIRVKAGVGVRARVRVRVRVRVKIGRMVTISN